MLAAAATAASVVAGVLVFAGGDPAGAASPPTPRYTDAASVGSSFSIDVRGNGHGHGLSQYGAEGAAMQGLTYKQILAFYYPHTTLKTLAPYTISVLLSNTGSQPTVAAQPGLHVSGVSGALPTGRTSRYKLVRGAKGGTTLYGLTTSAKTKKTSWVQVKSGLPSTSVFSNSGTVRVYLTDGTSTDYHGTIAAVPSGSGLMAVNYVDIDDYVAGVVPREMPASWDRAALRAQAVAARTYARYEAAHSSGAYDVCDTSSCQVYGGATHYSSSGSVLWTDDQGVLAGDRNKYLIYHHAPILAQFSASNGGWTTDGGMPYLVAERDPYDDKASGDPYMGYQSTISSGQIAGYYGLSSVTGISIVGRDGNGMWGGRVTEARIIGLDSSGQRKTVRTDGSDLQWAMGVGSDWLTIVANHKPQGRLRKVTVDGSVVRLIGWAVDLDHVTHSPPMRVSVDGQVVTRFRTRILRPHLVDRFDLHYKRPGFRKRVHPGAGTHRICVTAVDTDGLGVTRLGCKTVTIGS